MCVCPRLCAAAHVLCSVIYICAGAVQLIAGIFFLVSLPVFKIGSNLWTGAWNVVVGVGGAVFSCVGDLNPGKHQVLLYLTISILFLNIVNLVVLELGEWRMLMPEALKKVIEERNIKKLVLYARTTTSISSLVGAVTSFIDAQFMFCWLEHSLSRRGPIEHNETTSDIEYIIPRVKNGSMGKNNAHNVFNQYAQSWVFDSDAVGSDSSYNKLAPFCGSKTVILKRKQETNKLNNVPTHSVQPVVLVEDSSDAISERQLQFMTSFPRTPSPNGMSSSSSPDSSSVANPAPIYECLEKLTEPAVYQSRLDSALEANVKRPTPSVSPRPCSTAIGEQVQYASLMMELQKTIVAKFPQVKSPVSENITRQSSRRASSQHKSSTSDTEFSKELEAALQIIQDLESPNTIDTPSDGVQIAVEGDCRGSSKSLNEVPLIGKNTSTCMILRSGGTTVVELTAHNRHKSVVHIVPEDRPPLYKEVATRFSGHRHKAPVTTDPELNSCSLTQTENENNIEEVNINFTPSLVSMGQHLHRNSATPDKDYLTPANDFKMKNIVPPKPKKPKNRTSLDMIEVIDCNLSTGSGSVTSEKNNNSIDTKILDASSDGGDTITKRTRWSLKNILKKKPMEFKLTPELECSIIKSESLAHLSELELIARYNQNKEIHRRIEERVWQRINGTSLSDSTC